MSSIPAWGLCTAAPHQFLIHIRGGRIIAAAQGGRAWRWPGDAVALVDTTVRRLQFTADQVTREKTGVQVTGLAVYRVVAPLLAWRMLDLEDPSRLGEILTEMFVGATRRLVANLSLEDCLTRRKDALAAELMAEVAPVVEGRGRAEDGTERGWGVALDTIEVQDVRVLSREVFERLQAPYRARLALDAVAAHAEVARAEAAQREAEEKRAEEHRRAMHALEQARLEAERARQREEAEHAADLEQFRLAAALERRRQEAEAAAREAEAHAVSATRVAREEAEAVRVRAEAEAERLRAERGALNEVSEARLRELLLTRTIPEAARALRGMVDEVRVRPDDLEGLVDLVGRIVGAARE